MVDGDSQRTPQVPRGPRPTNCCGSLPWSVLTLRTRRPTPNGPMIVHRVIAQMTMRKISELSFLVVLPSRVLLAKIPRLSATDAMRKPISPRETIAVPRIEAGYNDKGFSGFTDAFKASCRESSPGLPPIAWEVAPPSATVAVVEVGVFRDSPQCHLICPNVLKNAMMVDNRIGNRTSQSPVSIFPKSINRV